MPILGFCNFTEFIEEFDKTLYKEEILSEYECQGGKIKVLIFESFKALFPIEDFSLIINESGEKISIGNYILMNRNVLFNLGKGGEWLINHYD